MTTIYISLGSNINPDVNIRSGLKALQSYFGELLVSSVYENSPIGFEGDDFYNLVVRAETDKDLHSVIKTLREIELKNGRVRNSTRFSSRTLDMDLLLYGDMIAREQEVTVPRDEITKYAFVLGPLAEIAGQETHPVSGECYADLWQTFDQTAHPMKIVEIR